MKDKVRGWERIYSFAFLQKIKGKSFRITTLILFLIALFSMPLLLVLSQGKDTTSIESVYVLTEIDGINSESFINSLKETSKKSELYSGLEYHSQNISKEDIDLEIKNADKSYNKIFLTVSNTEMGIVLQFLYGDNTGVSGSDVNIYSDFVKNQLNNIILSNLDIEGEELEYIKTPVTKKVLVKNENWEIINTGEETKALGMPLYTMGCIIFGLYAFIISINSEAITSSIITEKSSRVIEYIMISVKPMAIVVGKVCAMLSITIIEILIFLIGLFISVKISPVGLPSLIKDFISSLELGNIGPGIIILSILIFLVGFLMFSVISAMLGATVSRIEEAAEASKLYMTLMFVGIYMSMGLIILQMIGIDTGIFDMVVYLLPISSPIALPFYLIIGKAPILVGIVSLIILIACLVLVTMFVSKVYGYILYHKGSKIKVIDLFRISKDLKKEVN